jgi:hypothetical protein
MHWSAVKAKPCAMQMVSATTEHRAVAASRSGTHLAARPASGSSRGRLCILGCCELSSRDVEWHRLPGSLHLPRSVLAVVAHKSYVLRRCGSNSAGSTRRS